MNRNEMIKRLNAEERITHPHTGRTIFKTIRGYYVVHSGGLPRLYGGSNINDALAVWEYKR